MSETTPGEPDLRGIGGWLLLVVLQLAIPPVILAVVLVITLIWHPDLAGRLMTLSTISIGAVSGYAVFCLVRLFQKRRIIPTLMTIYYGICLMDLIVYWIRVAGNFPDPQRFTFPIYFKAFYPLDMILQLVLTLVWLGYFSSSVRVKNTFVN